MQGASKSSMSPVARPGPSRTVGYSQVCLLLILLMGFMLLFSYQSEIYVMLAGKDLPANPVSSRPVTRVTHSDAMKAEQESERSREETRVFAEEQPVQLKSSDLKSLSANPRLSDANSSKSASPTPPSKEPYNKYAKSLKYVRNKAYEPLEESVQANIVSSKFKFVIKVLASNSYGSLLRCLNSLALGEYGGDPVDIHIYIDHFEISETAEFQRRQRRLFSESSDDVVGEREIFTDPAEVLIVDDVVKAARRGEPGASEEKASDIGVMEKKGLWETIAKAAIKELDEISSIGKKKLTEESLPEGSEVEKVVKKDQGSKKIKKKSKSPAGSRKTADEKELLEEPKVQDKVVSDLGDAVNPKDWGIIEQKLRDARRVLALADKFVWKFGAKVVHYRSKTAGYQSQWVDSWWPASDDEFAFVVEEDMEVSPLFYRYIRALIATYYYQPEHFDHSLYGISLQRPTIVPGKNGQPIKVDVRTRLFMYEMVGIWGQVLFPGPWKEFRTWYDNHKSHEAKPFLEGMLTTDWYREHGEKMWTPWFLKFVHSRGYYNMYTNFLFDRVLSVTHRSEGVKTKKYAGCDSVLMGYNGTWDLDVWHMAPMKTIKRYDFCFKEVKVGRFANKSANVAEVLSAVQEDNTVLMLSTFSVPEALVRNWICNLKKLGISNYVFFGNNSDLLEDLARRGHAAIHFETSERFKEDIEKEVAAVLVVLKLGYNVWFTRTDTLWVGDPLTVIDTAEADFLGLERSMLEMFFVRSTKQTIILWSSFYNQLPVEVVNGSGHKTWETTRETFLQSLEYKEGIKVMQLKGLVFTSAEELTEPPTAVGADIGLDANVVLFGGLKEWTTRELTKKATQLGLWNLDDDLACAMVLCESKSRP